MTATELKMNMFNKITRKVADELVVSIRKGDYTDCAEFSMTGIASLNNPKDQQMVSLLGSMVCAYVNESLNDESLTMRIKANYKFVAFLKKTDEKRLVVGCGFVSNTETKKIKKMAKESEGTVCIREACAVCYEVSPKLQKCGGCRSVAYCCREHQLSDWKEHKTQCKLIQNAKQG
jgi:hypothetical protein